MSEAARGRRGEPESDQGPGDGAPPKQKRSPANRACARWMIRSCQKARRWPGAARGVFRGGNIEGAVARSVKAWTCMVKVRRRATSRTVARGDARSEAVLGEF